jgi:hypothetical protein
MSDEPINPDDLTDDVPAAAPGSVLDVIGGIRDEIEADDEPLVIPLVAYQNRVALRFDYPEGGFAQIRRAVGGGQTQRRVKTDDEVELKAMADLIVACCSGVVEVKEDEPETEWQSIDPTGNPVRINRRLAELLKIDVPRESRKPGQFILRHLYSPRAHRTGVFRGDPTILADGLEVQAWLDAGGVRVAERLPGE